ncbi:MAG TPA: hypothetical protein VH951_04665 [Dehalococcoidia bacterium]
MTTRINYRYIAPMDAEAEKACRLTKDTVAQRQEPPEDFFAGAKTQEPLPNGFELRFDIAPGIESRVDTFITEEQQCCPFFAFESWQDAGEMVVRILRPEETNG